MSPEDKPFLTALEGHSGTQRFLGSLPVRSASSPANLFVLLDSGDPVGIAGFVPSGALDGSDVELICVILEQHRGRGIAREACQALVKWAFDAKLYERVIACVERANTVASRLVLALRFEELATRPYHPDTVVFARARDTQ